MNPEINHRALLNERLRRSPAGRLDARTTLRHFALITYAVAPERLAKLIPTNEFEVARFQTQSGEKAFFSAVAFLDVDFRFPRLAPGIKFCFYQTNHRAYVIEKTTRQPAVWFFGTNLGSRLVHLPRTLWKIPWHHSNYTVDCRFDSTAGCYEKYSYNFDSEWCRGEIKIRDTGEPVSVLDGFASMDEMKLLLTHPVRGFYRRLDGRLGTYQVWHQEMEFTRGVAEHLYFSLYEKMGLLTKAEMQQPHSIFLCPEVEFDVHLPPKNFSGLP
jgi:hypothetical protein